MKNFKQQMKALETAKKEGGSDLGSVDLKSLTDAVTSKEDKVAPEVPSSSKPTILAQQSSNNEL